MVYEVVLAEAHRRCLAALATFNLALDRLIVGKSHVGHVVAAAVALKVVKYHRLALSRCALHCLTHLLRLRPYEAYDAAVALAGLCAVGTRSLRCAALRHLVEVLLVLRHMGLGDLARPAAAALAKVVETAATAVWSDGSECGSGGLLPA